MRGLRTKENDNFKIFFEKVQDAANKEGKVFFLDFGECKDISYKDMEIDELFGWLINKDFAEEFESYFLSNQVSNKWDAYCVWVIPKIVSEELIINFE